MAPTVIPKTPSELEEFMNDSAKMAEVVKDPAGFKELIGNYVEAFHKSNQDFNQEVKDMVQTELVKFYQEHEASVPKGIDLTPGGGVSNKIGDSANAPGRKVDELFNGPSANADYLRSIWYRNNHPDAITNQEKLREIRDSFGSTIPSDGGFLIPERLRAQLLQVALESAVVRPRATVVPMDSLRVPFPAIDDTDHTSSVFGGMIGFWTEEAGELAESNAKFSRVVLEAKKLTGYSEVPNELFADSIISFQAFLSQTWPAAISFFEDVAFLTGSGVGEPLGVYNSTAAVTPTRGTANEVNLVDIASMYARMLPSSLNSAVWVVSPAVIAQLLQLVNGTNGGPSLWLQGGFNAAGAPMLSLLGRPLVVSEKAPDLGSTGDISFIDFGFYLLGDRQSMSMDTSADFKFRNDVTAVRIIERVDGRPWIQSALTPHNGGDTLSPIVKLSDQVTA